MKAPQLKILRDKAKEYDDLVDTEYKSDSVVGESITVHNGAAARAQLFIYGGKTKQKQREGYNLLKLNSTLSPANTDTETIFKEVKDPRFTKNISIVLAVKSGESYYISGDFSLLNSSVTREMFSEKYPEDGGACTRLSNRNKKGGISFDKDGYWVVEFLPSPISDEQIEKIENSFMIVHGNEEKEHEAYGVSPSPEFSSPIESGKDRYAVKRQNKNLAYDVIYSSPTIRYYPLAKASYGLKKDKYYCVSFDTENTGMRCYMNVGQNYGTRKISTYFDINLDGNKKFYIIQALEDITKTSFNIINRTDETSEEATGYISNLMIEEIVGVTTDEEALKFVPTDFIEHQEQNYGIDLPSGIEVNEINGVKDYFEMDLVEEKGLFKIKELRYVQILKRLVLGENTYWVKGSASNDEYSVFQGTSSNLRNVKENMKCFSDKFIYKNNNISQSELTFESICTKNDTFRISIANERLGEDTSATGFRNWLKNNSVEAVFVLENPITTVITDKVFIEQLEAMLNGKTHHGITHVDIESLDGNPLLTLRLDYFVSNRITYDERFSNLENAILSSGNNV